jgi:hypothetical protein
MTAFVTRRVTFLERDPRRQWRGAQAAAKDRHIVASHPERGEGEGLSMARPSPSLFKRNSLGFPRPAAIPEVRDLVKASR